MEIRETISQYTQARQRISPPAAAQATWLSPARRRGRGTFSLGASDAPLGIPVSDLTELLGWLGGFGLPGARLYWDVEVASAVNRWIDRTLESCPGSEYPEIVISDDKRMVAILGKACNEEWFDILGQQAEAASGPSCQSLPSDPGRQSCRDDFARMMTRISGSLAPVISTRPGPPEPGASPARAETNLLRYGLLALGVVGVGAVGYMLWRSR